MLKYKKEPDWEKGRFQLNGKDVSHKEVEYLYNALAKELSQLESMLNFETGRYNQLLERHQNLLGLKANIKG